MNLNVNVEKNVANLEVVLSADETKVFIDKEVAKKIANLEVDGFRKGKMPKAMFLKKYGEASVFPDVIDAILNDVYPKMISENQLQVVASPNFNFEAMTISVEEGFKVEGTVELMPEVTIEGYATVKDEITMEEVEVTSTDVDNTINTLLDAKSIVEVVEREAKLNDIVVFDFEGFVDGVAFEGGKAENHSLTLGSGSFIPGFEDQLVGVKADDALDVVVSFPTDYQAEELAGKEATFKCLVHEVKAKVLPELTGEVIKEIKEYEAEDEATLRAQIEEKLQAQKVEQSKNKYNHDIISKLIEMADVKAPQSMVDQETDHALENFKQQITSQGMDYNMYLQMMGGDEQALRSQIDGESRRRVEEMLVIDAVVKAENVEVTDADADAKVEELVVQTGMSKEEIMTALGGDMSRLKRDIAYDKAYKLVLGA